MQSLARAKAVLLQLLILLGGLLALWGSYGPWGTCSVQPCDSHVGLPYLVSTSGFEFGTGVATAIVAVCLVLIGLASLGRGESPAIQLVAVGLAIVEFLLAGIHIARFHVSSEYLVYGPDVGLFAVMAGAAVAAAGGAFPQTWRRGLSKR
jgi:hypothetical protein